VRRLIALLATAILSGCGLTDGPNRTGSAWLDSLDLGPEGLESVSVGLRALEIDTILEPGVPALNGMGTLVLGGTKALSASTSLWFAPSDSTRWLLGSSFDRGAWTLELLLDTSCSSEDGIEVRLWSRIQDTLAFLSGTPMTIAERTVSATCNTDTKTGNVRVTALVGDSNRAIYHSSDDFGLRIEAPGFQTRQIVAARLVDGKGDTLLPGLLEGRSAWGVRWTDRKTGSLASSLGAGKRLRLRFDAAALRSAVASRLGLPTADADSFDNAVSIFSARAVAPVISVSEQVARRFRLASWVVRHADTSFAAIGSQVGWKTSRPEDGASMEGTLVVRDAEAGAARVCLLAGSDSIPFLTRDGQVQYSFVLLEGDSVEAPMSGDPGWTKFQFKLKGGKVRFIRQVLASGVAADDQIQGVDDGSYVYRDEAVAVEGRGKVRFEARTAFSRILNRKAQQVWTDLYPVAVQKDAVLDDNATIELAAEPIDSVTFLLRRRITGAVQ